MAQRRLEESFFDEQREWSKIKLRILTKYSDAYQRIRGGTNRFLYYVDGFAGTGRYGIDENGGEGSSLQMARFAQHIADSGKPYRLVCINVEQNRRNYERLQEWLSGFDASLVQTRFGDFASHIPNILEETHGWPALFFLDPLGVKPVMFRTLQPIMVRPDTEYLIVLMTKRLRMLAGFEDSTSKDRGAKLRLVSEVLGEDPDDGNPEWLQQWKALNDSAKWEQWAALAYGKRLRSENPQLQYVLTYPVRETFRAAPKYYLVFVTRSDKGIPVMNDLLCTEEDDLYERTGAWAPPEQLSMLPDRREEERDRRLAELLDEMHTWGRNHQGCNRARLIRHFVFENFGTLKQKHYRYAFGQLMDAGRVRAVGPGGIDNAPLLFV
jgi:three-Cys-motif partner protein